MRIGVVGERRELENTLGPGFVLELPSDIVLALADRMSLPWLVHTIRVHNLTGLVIIACDEADAWQRGQEALRRSGQDPFALRLVNLADLGAPGRHTPSAAPRAARLVAAAAAMVRQYPWLRPANIRLRLGGLRGRLTRRDILRAPKPRYDVIPAVDPALCSASRGCDLCQTACPYNALSTDGLAATVDKDRCRNCGLCLPICPSGALQHPYYQPQVLDAGLAVLLAPSNEEPPVAAFVCPSAKAAMRDALRRQLPGPTDVLPLEMPSAGFFHLYLALRAFDLGASGVALIHCDGECGRACDSRLLGQRLESLQAILDALGLGACRLAAIPASSPRRLANSLATFTARLSAMGPAPLGGPPLSGPSAGQGSATGRLIAALWRKASAATGHPVAHEELPFGQPHLDEAACSLCHLCADACPTGALRYDETPSAAALEFVASLCTGCRLCSRACPEGALSIHRRLVPSLLSDPPSILKTSGVRSCPKCRRPYATDAIVTRVLARLGPRAAILDTSYCPDCRMIAGLG